MIFRIIHSLFCLLVLTGSLVGQADNFVKANDAYNQAKYEEAIELYQGLVDGDNVSEALYYNLANAYQKSGDLARAILFYERTLKLDPSHQAALANVSIARSAITTDITDIPDFFLLKWWNNIALTFGSAIWSILGIVLWLIAVLGFRKWLLQEQVNQKKNGFMIMISCLIFGLVFMILGYTKHRIETSQDMAIIMHQAVVLKSAPDERSEDVFTLGAGVKITILDQIEDWVKVELADREEGWIPVDTMEII